MKRIFFFFLILTIAFCFGGCEKENVSPNNNSSPAITDQTGYVVNPKANFECETTTSFQVTFKNKSSNATSYLWDFGDGTTSTNVNPRHTYVSIGVKYVNLRAYNGDLFDDFSVNVDMTSYIKMINKSDNKYKIYIDGVSKGILSGGYYNVWEVTPGVHTVRVLQQNGYTLWQTDESYTLSCYAGFVTSKEFPEDAFGKSASNEMVEKHVILENH